MTTERSNEDESVSDLPDPQITKEEAKDVKGGGTSTTPVSTGSTTTVRPIVPHLIDPCW